MRESIDRIVPVALLIGVLAVASAPAAASAGSVPEPTFPSLEGAAEHAVERMLGRDLALMDTGARARVLVAKERAASEDLPELDRAARVIGDVLYRRNLDVVLLEAPGADVVSGERFGARTVWLLSLSGGEPNWRLRLRGDDPRIEPIIVPYVEKPWVQSLEGLEPGRSDVFAIRGESGLRSRPEEARASALADAIGQLAERVLDGLEPAGWLERRGLDEARQFVKTALSSPASAAKYVDDWYLGEEPRSFGRVWRAHVLLGVTQDELRELQAKVRRRVDGHGKRLGLAVLAFLAALPLGFFVYLKLDAATRGYFTPWLRLAALGGIALAGGAFWWNLF